MILEANKIIYIDLSKTFFIKNGVAYDYFTQQNIFSRSANYEIRNN